MHFVEAKGILSALNGMNLYRGCTHGCIYCDSRSVCYGFTHAFEDIEVKRNAPELLEQKLKSKRKRCMIGTGAMCDPYMQCEEELLLTRRCLELIDHYGYGVAIQTKSDRILRDFDLLKSINEKAKAVVQITITTFDDNLCRIVEPNVCVTSKRLKVLETMKEAGIPSVVWMSPILPYINDSRENVEAILQECARLGVKGVILFGMGMTLREGNREYYYAALDRHFPGLKKKYQMMYGNSYEIVSENSKELMDIFYKMCKESGMMWDADEIFTYMREFPEDKNYHQLSLF